MTSVTKNPPARPLPDARRSTETKSKAARWGAVAVGVAMAVTAVGGAPAAAQQQTSGGNHCDPKISATVDAGYTELFGDYGDTAGRWTGADSSYSVPLPDGSTAWIYSDTFLGTVDDDGSRPQSSPFVHNSIIVEDDGALTTYTGGTEEAPASLVEVPGGDESQNWYWFGDATLEGDILRVLVLEFERTGTGPFDFAFVDTALASFSVDGISFLGLTELPDSDVQWASAIHEDRDFTYIFGVEDQQSQKFMHLARVPSGQIATARWEYFGDAGWTSDATASAPLLEGVSNEFSVTRYQGRFAVVTGDSTEALSSKIVMYRSAELTGPFTDKIELYTTPETNGNVYTYNAKAHPQLGSGGELFITYNVNSFDTADVYADVDNYRPRYVNVKARAFHC